MIKEHISEKTVLVSNFKKKSKSVYKTLRVTQVKTGNADSWVEADVWRMELYLSVGIMALGLLSLLAVTSLPSVASTVNWREFTFVQVGSHTALIYFMSARAVKQACCYCPCL